MRLIAGQLKANPALGCRALGAVVAVWLNLALQPCAMAFDSASDHDCPDCPPARVHEQHHDSMDVTMRHDVPCAVGTPDCMLSDDFSHDGRSGQLNLKDAPSAQPVALIPGDLRTPCALPARVTPGPRYATVHAGAPPPLHVLHCVYLK